MADVSPAILENRFSPYNHEKLGLKNDKLKNIKGLRLQHIFHVLMFLFGSTVYNYLSVLDRSQK